MKLIWTIHDDNFIYPDDDTLYNFAQTLGIQSWENRTIHRIPSHPTFGVERFGNSCHLYQATAGQQWARVGLFTWGMVC